MQGEQGRTAGEGRPTPTQVRASSRPVEITAHERPSLGRGNAPAAQTGDVTFTPSSRAETHHVTGQPAPCGAAEQKRWHEMYPCTHDGPGPRPVVFYPRAAQYAPASHGPRHRK